MSTQSVSAELELVLRLLLAAALGAVIGFQREKVGKQAGLRTNMLICMGAALITMVSTYGFTGGDPTRIAAGVIVSIGFLGGGLIWRHESEVSGLTTAATVWLVAAIGLAVGTGLYIVAIATTVLALIVLLLPHSVG